MRRYPEYLMGPYKRSRRTGTRIRRAVLIAGILIGMSPSLLHGASHEEHAKQPPSQNHAAGDYFQTDQKAEQIAQAAYASLGTVGELGEMGQGAGFSVSDVIERMDDEIAKAGDEIAGLHAAGTVAPQRLVDEIYFKKQKLGKIILQVISTAGSMARKGGANPSQEGKAIGAAIRKIPDSVRGIRYFSFESRIKAYLDLKRAGLSPRERGILTGHAMLAYDRDWEYVASVTGRSVYEAGGTRADMESVIISIFWEYRF